MKDRDLYELFNEIEIDEKEFKEVEVTDIDRAKVKKAVKASVYKKRKMNWKTKAASAVAVCVLSVGMLGAAFPATAGNIPIIGDIFRFVDNGGTFDNYKEYSSALNLTEESNGIQITINDAIYDGKTVSVTYTMKSEQDLGEQPSLGGFLDIKGTSGIAGSSAITKVGEHEYVGLITASKIDGADMDQAKVNWNIGNITIDSHDYIKGKWKFAFSLDAAEQLVQQVGKNTARNGVEVAIDKLSISPMSFVVYFNQIVSKEVTDKWHRADVDIEIKDDLGNEYPGVHNGGKGDGQNNFSWSKTFKKLDPNATKLVITPHVSLYEYTSENFGGVEIDENGNETEISIPTKEGKGREEFTLDEIVIELEK
ncbi:DUF4179 domain-containing protein [Sporosarcina sp. USHLN248]|uniref:DUF4179 domain-containing protein n=1 Tax=Sporosarcina sp. USHLN248 TaxID=3081300 RepID=UPI003018B843